MFYDFKKMITVATLAAFLSGAVVPPGYAGPQLSAPALIPMGAIQPFDPVLMRGVKVYADDPFRFSFVMDRGGSAADSEDFKKEADRNVKYFLASVTMPENDVWVNLSPYEPDRIIAGTFGRTGMGQDLLDQDRILKQVVSTLTHPDTELGRQFWDEVYAKASKEYGTTDIPLDMFSKVWILPASASVYEKAATEGTGSSAVAYIVDAKLKVMTESDYLAARKSSDAGPLGSSADGVSVEGTAALSQQVLREVVLPALERRVNEDRAFAPLRQIYHSLILARWFKGRVKQSILNSRYADRSLTDGIIGDTGLSVDQIYAQYLEQFKAGAVDLIREDVDPATGDIIPRRYFSGGFDGSQKALDAVTRFETSEEVLPRSDAAMSLEDVEFEMQPVGQQMELFDQSLFPDIPMIRVVPERKEALGQALGGFERANNFLRTERYGAFTWQQNFPISSFTEEGKVDGTLADGPGLIRKVDELLAAAGVPATQADVERVLVSESGVLSSEEMVLFGQMKARLLQFEDMIKQVSPTVLSNGSVEFNAVDGAKIDDYLRTRGGLEEGQGQLTIADSLDRKMEVRKLFRGYYEDLLALRPLARKIIVGLANGFDGKRYSQQALPLSDSFVERQMTAGYYFDREGLLQRAGDGRTVKEIAFAPSGTEKKALADVFEDSPQLMYRVFYWSARHEALIAVEVIDAMRVALGRLAQQRGREGLSAVADVQREFVRLFGTAEDVADILIQMNEVTVSVSKEYSSSLLGLVIPEAMEKESEFADVRHHFSVLYHTIYLLKVLEKASRDTSPEWKQVRDVYNGLKGDPTAMLRLRFGIIFHDLGKDDQYNPFDRPHPLTAANALVPEIMGERMGLPENVTNDVRWLDWYHQNIAARAAYQPWLRKENRFDIRISDQLDFIRGAGRGLNDRTWGMLYLITVADLYAYRPDEQRNNNQRRGFFDAYYQALLPWFKREGEEKTGVEKIWTEQAAAEAPTLLGRRWSQLQMGELGSEDQKDAYKILQGMYPAIEIYRMTDPMLAFHLDVLKKMAMLKAGEDGVLVKAETQRTDLGGLLALLTGINRDRPGIMYNLTGLLAAMGVSIHNAQIANVTIKDGDGVERTVVLDRLEGYFGTSFNMDAWEKIMPEDLRQAYEAAGGKDVKLMTSLLAKSVVVGLLDLDDIFQKVGVKEFKRVPTHGKQKTDISFHPENGFTRMKLDTNDRNGLLYIVSRALSQRFGVNIEGAPSSTPETGAQDEFFLTQNGQPLPEALQAEMKEFFETLLDQEIITQDQVLAAARDKKPLQEVLDMAQKDVAVQRSDLGGIDLTENAVGLNVGGNAGLDLWSGVWDEAAMSGLRPVFIGVHPMRDLSTWLGSRP